MTQAQTSSVLCVFLALCLHGAPALLELRVLLVPRVPSPSPCVLPNQPLGALPGARLSPPEWREAACNASLGGHGCGTPGTQDPPLEGAGPRLDPDKERPNRKTHKWLQKNALCGVTVQKILKRRLEKLLPQALRYHISTPTENHAWRLRGSRGRPGTLPAPVLRILLHLAGAEVQPRS